jgi:3-isopropylmalate/(R)-2-methylmalate dehydratase small subunit
MMRPFTTITAVAAPLLRDNVDTDAIIPSREIVAVAKTGLAPGLFADWRYVGRGSRELSPQFVLNDPRYQGAGILLAGANFGCGSSREHAVWALAEFGFRVLVAGSFNPIFFRNCARNGMLAATLPQADIEALAAHVSADPQAHLLSVDLASQSIQCGGVRMQFSIPEDVKCSLLVGLDAIDQTLQQRAAIDAFRAADRRQRPWVYDSVAR